ncbi:MAG: class II aldolase/adducin family protein [Firmicutes bacterium]|nr:class II aldolase/adducin family protein [Bacillota bacterium]
MASEYQLRRDIVEVGRRLWIRGYVAANDGNISVRLGPDDFLCTPTGVSKGFMTPEMLIRVDGRGAVKAGDLKPSSEIKMHLAVYRDRPDVAAVVHAHPPISTAFAVAGVPLSKCILPEVILTLGRIPLAAYGTPSTDEIPRAIAEYLKDHNAFLLENHGALTLGADVFQAYYRMETMEHFAAISLAARQLGGERELPPERIGQLMEIRSKLGLTGLHPGCQEGGAAGKGTSQTQENPRESEDKIRRLVTEIVTRVLRELKRR